MRSQVQIQQEKSSSPPFSHSKNTFFLQRGSVRHSTLARCTHDHEVAGLNLALSFFLISIFTSIFFSDRYHVDIHYWRLGSSKQNDL